MSDSKHKAYRRLRELHAEAHSATYEWTSSGKFTEWKQNVQTALRRLYGDECDQVNVFGAVRYSPVMLTTGTPDSVFEDAFLDGIKNATAIIRSGIQEFEDYELSSAVGPQGAAERNASSSDGSARKVFVVHGHDNEMKETVARFLEHLDFRAIILHEQASRGDTVIEKFERNSAVSFAVVLLSPDDVGAATDRREHLNPRARQNVVLELGYFIGKLGRANVCPLVRGSLELPSDFHGVAYVPFDGGDWKLHLVRELKHQGFSIDVSKTL